MTSSTSNAVQINPKYPSRDFTYIVLLIGGALLLRIIYLLQIQGNPFWIPKSMDPYFYHSWASAIVQKSLPSKTAFQGLPLYPYFLACIYWICGINVFAARLAQMVIGALSCGLLYIVGKRFFSPKTAFLAGCIAVCYKPFIFYDGLMVGANLTIFLYLLNLLFAHTFYKNPTTKNAWIWGIQTGISILCRPAILLFPIVTLIGMIRKCQKQNRASLVKMSVYIFVGMFLVLNIVLIRNYLVADDYVLTAHGGLNFYIGNNHEATGKFHAPPGVGRQPETMIKNAHHIAEQHTGRKLKSSESSRYWKQQAYRFIRENPGRFIKLIFRKAHLFWQGGEIADFRNIEFFKRYSALLRIPLFTFWIVVPWVLLGLILSFRTNKDIILLHYFLWSYFFSILTFFINSRYRLPVVPIMLLFAAHSFFYLTAQYKQHKKRFVLLSITIVLLYVLTGYNKEKPRLADDYNELAARYIIDHKNYEKAALLYRQAYQLEPQNQYVVFNLARLYFDLKKYAESLQFFKYAVTLDKNDFEAYNFIGIILSQTGKPDEAIEYFRKVIHLKPNYFKAYNNCALSFIQIQQYEAAKKMLRQSLQINPQQPEITQRLSDLDNK